MSSAVKATERDRGKKKRGYKCEKAETCLWIPLAPHHATAALCPALLIPVKLWSRNQRMSNQDFFSTIPFQTPT